MIIIGGTIQFETDDRETLFDKIRQMMADSQAEQGCLAYEFSLDISKPNVLHLYEVWETAEALEVHRQSPHTVVFRKEIGDSFVQSDIKRYVAEIAS